MVKTVKARVVGVAYVIKRLAGHHRRRPEHALLVERRRVHVDRVLWVDQCGISRAIVGRVWVVGTPRMVATRGNVVIASLNVWTITTTRWRISWPRTQGGHSGAIEHMIAIVRSILMSIKMFSWVSRLLSIKTLFLSKRFYTETMEQNGLKKVTDTCDEHVILGRESIKDFNGDVFLRNPVVDHCGEVSNWP